MFGPRPYSLAPHIQWLTCVTAPSLGRASLHRETPRSERAMLELAARLHRISDSVDSELRVILTPAQRFKLDSLRHPLTFILKHEDSSGASTVDTVYLPAKH